MSDPAEQWLAYTKIKGKDAQAKARQEWLSKLDAKGLKEHEQKRAAIKKKELRSTDGAYCNMTLKPLAVWLPYSIPLV